MQRLQPTISGKAWEYGLAVEFRKVLNDTVLRTTPARVKAENYFKRLDSRERERIRKAANEMATFIVNLAARTRAVQSIEIQSDAQGQKGDVRDILIHTPNDVIGISAKVRHEAIKSPRLSYQRDFGQVWYGSPCSERYWNAVKDTFDALEAMRKTGPWKKLKNKYELYYRPMLDAFIDEIEDCPDPTKMMQFLLGRNSFYKVIKTNGTVKVQSFNFDGSLKWGKQIELPSKIINVERALYSEKDLRKQDTAIMCLDGGWQVSFRIHNAESQITPSVKFDVNLIGAPVTLSCHEIPYG